MLDRAKLLRILVESNRRSLEEIRWALEALETGPGARTNFSTLQRAFHTIKHDARSVGLGKLADVAAACEAIVARALDHHVGLPLELLHAATDEIRAATETVAAGGRHRIDERLLDRLASAAAERKL